MTSGRLLEQLERTYCIDRARTFSTAFSNGGFFSNILGCAMADRFAAIAPVSGGKLTVPCTPTRAMPVLIHHGRADTIIPVEQARQARDAWVEKDGCREHTSDGCDWYRGCRGGGASACPAPAVAATPRAPGRRGSAVCR